MMGNTYLQGWQKPYRSGLMHKEGNHGILIFIAAVLFLIGISIFCYVKFYVEKKQDQELVDLNAPSSNNSLTVESYIYDLMNLAIGGQYQDGFSNAMDNKMQYDFTSNQIVETASFDQDTLSSLIYYYAFNNQYLKKEDNAYILSEKNAQKIYSKIFGPYLEYKEIKESTMCPTLSFNQNKKEYTFRGKCQNTTDISRYNKIIDVKEQEDTIVVTEQVGYYFSGWLENNVFKTYTDAINKTNSIGTISESTEVQINNLKDDLSQYQYTFKRAEDQYYFYSIERIQ